MIDCWPNFRCTDSDWWHRLSIFHCCCICPYFLHPCSSQSVAPLACLCCNHCWMGSYFGCRCVNTCFSHIASLLTNLNLNLLGVVPAALPLSTGSVYSTDGSVCSISLRYPKVQTLLHLTPVRFPPIFVPSIIIENVMMPSRSSLPHWFPLSSIPWSSLFFVVPWPSRVVSSLRWILSRDGTPRSALRSITSLLVPSLRVCFGMSISVMP